MAAKYGHVITVSIDLDDAAFARLSKEFARARQAMMDSIVRELWNGIVGVDLAVEPPKLPLADLAALTRELPEAQ